MPDATKNLSAAIAALSSEDLSARASAAHEIYRRGRAPADRAVFRWWQDSELAALLLGPEPEVTVGLAVSPETFARLRQTSGMPKLAEVPPDQDAEEFELHFANDVRLDILTTRNPEGHGAIARYLGKFGEGVQQVEFRCSNVERATQILRDTFAINGVYAKPRIGANGALINFFLLDVPAGYSDASGESAAKVLVELYELPAQQ